MLQKILKSDISLSVVIEVKKESAGASSSIEFVLVVQLHKSRVDADGFR